MSQPTVTIAPGEVLHILGNTITFHVTAEQTGGAFALVEYVAAPHSGGPAPHTHETFEEVFYVVEGNPSFLLEGKTIAAEPGMCVVIPRGKVHTFGNPGPVPARMLTMNSPAGFELYFKELSLMQPPFDLEIMKKLWVQYDTVPVG